MKSIQSIKLAPEPVLRAYMEEICGALTTMRNFANHPEKAEMLSALGDALHNAPEMLLDYGSWMDDAKLTDGAVFRSINRHGQLGEHPLAGTDVARIVKKLAERAGLDASKYAGHSLRSGHATSAAIAGASERSIMNQTGHRSVQMVRRYIRDGNLFRENSGGKLGL